MMQKRTLYSLLLISFIVVFAASVSANEVTIQSKAGLARCAAQSVDVTADVTTDAISAIECVFEITTASDCGFITDLEVVWELPDGVLSNRPAVDYSQADGNAPDTIRFAAMRTADGDGVLDVGTHVVARIDFTTVDCCAGTVGIDNAVFTYPNPTGPITTQFVKADDATILPVAVNASTIGIINQNPTIEAIANATIPWGGTYNGAIVADDPDLVNGCEALSYAKVAGPTNLNVNATTGAISWVTTGADVCGSDVTVKVVDGCGAEATTTFNICVFNEPPEITCSEDMLIALGDVLTTSVSATDDVDAFGPGPHPLLYSLVSFDGPGVLTVNPATGDIVWPTLMTPAYSGVFTVTVMVTDSANTCSPCSPENADTCSFLVEVRAMTITIEKNHGPDGKGVIQGQPTTVSIDMLGSDYNNWPIAGYDLLIQYDPTGLVVNDVVEGDFFTAGGWEYFTYRFGPYGNCGSACPSGFLRIVALAEQNDGANHPEYFDNSVHGETQLAEITFLVTDDRTFECQYLPIRFTWYDCADNALSSVTGDTLLISRWVYDYVGSGGMDTYERIDMLGDGTLPTWYGAPAPLCDVSDKGYPMRHVNFRNGGVDVICADSIDAPGDVNLNGIAYEIADAVMFTNYFIDGLGAFGAHVDGSIAASDVNKDGITLSVADLVYLIRVVIGDAQPYPKVAYKGDYSQYNGNLSVGQDVAAMYIEIEGECSPELLVSGMDMGVKTVDGITHVIITPSLEANITNTFSGEFLAGVKGNILSIDAADINGTALHLVNVPKEYMLAQNYPNPFNPTTTITFGLKHAGDYALTIYNIQGRVVDTYSGNVDGAGFVEIEWDASNLASGVYFYRLTADNFSSVKKMVLLK
jgi:hypothetical protein